jgi:hypothetical protein
LKFDVEVKNVVRENQPDTFQNPVKTLYRFAYPLILVNGKPANHEELDVLNMADITSVHVIQPTQK